LNFGINRQKITVRIYSVHTLYVILSVIRVSHSQTRHGSENEASSQSPLLPWCMYIKGPREQAQCADGPSVCIPLPIRSNQM